MATNLISAVLADADKEAARAAIATAKTKMPFLISLSEDQKKGKRRMGQKSVEYVKLNVRGVQNFGNYIPSATVNGDEFEKDVTLISQLWDVRIVIASLLEEVDDTITAASVDSMKTADTVYDYLKKAAQSDAAVKTLIVEIAKRYEKQGKKAAPSVIK
jgi:hypothetical protein